MTTNEDKKTLRKKYEEFFAPWGKKIAKTGLTPNSISFLAIIMGVISCISYGFGYYENLKPLSLILGTIFLALSALFDMLDGSVARATGNVGYFGALLDRVFDRIAEWFFLLGIMIGNHSLPAIVLFCFEGMILASYVRSTAELRGGLKMPSSLGLFERKEKLTLLGFGCIIQAIFIEFSLFSSSPLSILELILLLIGFASNYSAFQRLLYAKRFYQTKNDDNGEN